MMLVVTRKDGESIVFKINGTDVVITVTKARAGKCRLVIEAPREIQVDRKEVHERKVAK